MSPAEGGVFESELVPFHIPCALSKSEADWMCSVPGTRDDEDEMKKMRIRATKAKTMYRRYRVEPAISFGDSSIRSQR